ncbi:MAG TPA: U32 family peptidase [Treponemataceae bacterium]|nr:U32 family peptidase [Treponemataceae bacterium]
MAELLAPAGNPEALDAAMHEGADAVYLGLKSFNARLRSSNFAWSQFEATVEALHKRGKKVLVTVNTVLQESETERMYRFLGYLDRMGPDGIIVQDFGVLNLARTYFPNLRIHASTQMNIASARSANAMSRAGVSRVVLARELGLSEVQQIRASTSCELEVFVHGALCVSESGLCLFSSFLGGKSANRGMCTQACRRLYTAEVSGGNRQGYYFSPNDLQLIDKIPDLVQAGVNSFKIEGRMKSAEYVGTVVSAYRYVLDNWEQDKKAALETARRILANDFARSKTRYWYDSSKAENVLNPDQAGGTGIFLGKVDKVLTEEDGRFALLKGGTYEPDVGDSIRLHKKDDSGRESHKIQEVRTEGYQTLVDIPAGFGSGDSVYLIQTKSMSKRYPHVLTKEMGSYRSQPGGEKLPTLKLELPPVPEAKTAAARATIGKRGAGKLSDFPEGVYVQVSTVEDLFSILSDRPVRAILELTSETTPALIGEAEGDPQVLPFSRRELIISLDPFLPQANEESLSKTLDILVEKGYSHFIVNNPGHIAMLRNRGLKLIAGPYLYTFNRWAADWLTKQGLYHIITPLENSRENLESSIDPAWRNQVFITVYSYPALFRMRFTLPKDYKFTYFSDRQNGNFKALSTPDGSYVFPEQPFVLADKTIVLKKAGFHRYLVDFSKTRVDRKEYRLVMDSIRKNTVIEEVSRFNWKEGFYDPDRMEELKAMTERAKTRKPADGKQGKGGSAHSQGRSKDSKATGPKTARGAGPKGPRPTRSAGPKGKR